MKVVSDPSLDSPEVMADVAKELTSQAISLGYKTVLEEMSQALGESEPKNEATEEHVQLQQK